MQALVPYRWASAGAQREPRPPTHLSTGSRNMKINFTSGRVSRIFTAALGTTAYCADARLVSASRSVGQQPRPIPRATFLRRALDPCSECRPTPALRGLDCRKRGERAPHPFASIGEVRQVLAQRSRCPRKSVKEVRLYGQYELADEHPSIVRS